MAVLTGGPCGGASGCAKLVQKRRHALTLLVLILFGMFPTRAQTSKEYQITIGVLGDDPFGPVLDQTVEGETINHRKLIIQRSQRAADLKGCHLVFISKSEKSRLADIFDSLGSASVLTVSETENFARRGGIINFYLDGNKVRFEINADAAQRKGIKISSQLLKLGRVIGPERAKENG